MTFRAFDLFCGAGGLSIGLRNAGFSITAAVDNWQPALDSYAINFDHPCFLENVERLDASRLAEWGINGPFDIVAGGPPCQGFSIQRIGEDVDTRNDLIFEFARVVAELHPRLFLMENVPGMLGKRGAAVAQRFQEVMSAAGYTIVRDVLEAAHFGVPQFRRRVFYVGWRVEEDLDFGFPGPTHTNGTYLTVRDAIADLPSPPTDFTPAPNDPLHRRMRLSKKNLERLALIPPGGGFESLPPDMRAACHRDGAAKIGHRNAYGRLDPDRPAGTITARFDSFTRGRFAHPWENRNISLREGARLQGFPDDHLFLGTQEEIAAQIGNAVPPPLAEAVCRRLFNALSGQHNNTERLLSTSATESGLSISLDRS